MRNSTIEVLGAIFTAIELNGDNKVHRQLSTAARRTLELKLGSQRRTRLEKIAARLGLTDTEVQHLKDRRKLNAVKEYKNRTGDSLLGAKGKIETFMMDAWGSKHFNHIISTD